MLLCWQAVQVNAQQTEFISDIRASLKKEPKFDFKLDNRNSFITKRSARIFGVKLGVDFDGKVKIGMGYNWLLSDITKPINLTHGPEDTEQVLARLRFRYVSPYFEYVFFRKDPWTISIPVNIGFGAAHYTYTDRFGVKGSTPTKPVLLYEPYMTAQYRLFKYAGLGAGVGYRFLFTGNKATGQNLNSPIYVLKFKVFIGDLYRDLFQ